MLAYTALSFANDSPVPIENKAGIKDSFSLVDQNGHAVTEKSWPSKYKLVFFGFTSCPDECPATLQKLTVALNALGKKAGKVQTLFITVDPDTDKPAVLKTYLKNFDKSIAGLTGTKKQITAAEESYKVFASKSEQGVDHSAFVYFMSPEGKLLQMFSLDESAENIVKGINSFIDSTAQK
jgi:protein SCO1/2